MNTLGTGAAKLALELQIGSARDITFTFTESDGTETDISLWTFELFFKRYAGDRQKSFSLTLGSGLSFPIYESNQLLAEISTSNSSLEEGKYYWELRRTDENIPLINGEACFSYEAETGDVETVSVTAGDQTVAVTIYGSFLQNQYLSFNRQTDDYTLVLADNFNAVETNKSTANTVTVPPNSSVAFPIGSQVNVLQYGAGQTTIAAGAGVTLRYSVGLKIVAQYDGCTLTKVGTDEWYLNGALEA